MEGIVGCLGCVWWVMTVGLNMWWCVVGGTGSSDSPSLYVKEVKLSASAAAMLEHVHQWGYTVRKLLSY